MILIRGRTKEKEQKFIEQIRHIDDEEPNDVNGGNVAERGNLWEARGYRCPQCKSRRFSVKENSWGIRLICSQCGYEDSYTGFCK
ncbi:MAG: hypothetical protein Q4B26_00560 [Eubacteriales bacterium]|nr:hypothetical protein [Eubacteriales bacterium]